MASTARVREKYFAPTHKGVFDTADLFPEKPPHIDGPWVRGPFPKQRAALYLLLSGACTGGGLVWQASKAGSKTTTGCVADFLVHHHRDFIGCTSVVGRESYPSLATNTWTDYAEMLGRIPDKFIKAITKPSTNSAGIIEWTIGGKTFFLSLSDSKTWASLNVGFAWVDEGHFQDEDTIEKLTNQLRQASGPRCMLITTNAAGKKAYHHRWANPKSFEKRPNWLWIQSTMYDNPALAPDYVESMEAKYPPGTARHRRWVLGESSQIEGVAFEMFDPDPTKNMHVVPAFNIPPDWPRGRGLDWGVVNSYCCVVWYALAPCGSVIVYRTHRERGRQVSWHAERMLELEQGEDLRWVPADPDVYKKVHEKETGVGHHSIADKFRRCGVRLTSADNNRERGLELMLDYLTIDHDRPDFLGGPAGVPKLRILDVPSNEPLIHCLETIEMRPEPSTGTTDAVDDVQKKNDDPYDALRYGLCAIPQHAPRKAVEGRKARTGYIGRRRIHGRRDVGVGYAR